MELSYQIGECMTNKPIVTKENTSVYNCVQEMTSNRVGSILIINDNKILKGILTEADIMRKIVLHKYNPETTEVKSIMNTNLETITADKTLKYAIQKMNKSGHKRLPVIENNKSNKLLGLITIKDIIKINPDFMENFIEKIDIKEFEHKPIKQTKFSSISDSEDY